LFFNTAYTASQHDFILPRPDTPAYAVLLSGP
jgi:hypothetical protein